jgi:pimeloyl-ACP methyl ester carboxylesterase
LHYRDWGFSVSEIEIEELRFHGTEDKFAPFQYGHYLDRHLPRSRLNTFTGGGHLFVLQLFGDVFENTTKAKTAF